MAELGGRLDIAPADGGGTLVLVELPIESVPLEPQPGCWARRGLAST